MTTEGVSAPGRCRLASARRQTTEAGRGARRANAIAAAATKRSATKRDRRGDDDDQRDGRCGPATTARPASAAAISPAARR